MDKTKNYVIGIDVGGTNTVFSLINFNVEVVLEIKNPTKIKTKDFINNLLAKIKNLVDEAKKINSESIIHGIVIGFPGTVSENGEIIFAPNLKVDGINLRNELKDFNIPVYVENDANLIALGQYYHEKTKGNEFNHMVGVTIGTGIGGGIIINKQLYRGFNFNAGEVGHIKIRQSDNDLRNCGCGSIGCYETFSSANAIAYWASKRLEESNLESSLKNYDSITAKAVFDEFKKGDRLAKDIVDETMDNFALGLANIINILNPEAIVIGGGVARVGEPLKEEIEKHLKKYAHIRCLDNLKIIISDLDDKSAVYGALSFFN